jgi:hypothetical protein
MRRLELIAISGTAMEHGLHGTVSQDIVHPALTPKATKPVFQAPAGLDVREAVAICYRNADRKPVHGALLALTSDGEVVEIVLLDPANGVDTSSDPAWITFGMNMSLGELLVKGDRGTVTVPWSIDDFGTTDLALYHQTQVRLALREAYLTHVASVMHRLDDLRAPETFEEGLARIDMILSQVPLAEAEANVSASGCADLSAFRAGEIGLALSSGDGSIVEWSPADGCLSIYLSCADSGTATNPILSAAIASVEEMLSRPPVLKPTHRAPSPVQ